MEIKVPKKDCDFIDKRIFAVLKKEKGKLLFNCPPGFTEFWNKVPKRGCAVLMSVSDLRKWSLRVWVESSNYKRKENNTHG